VIARIWRGVTPRDKGDAYVAYLERTGVTHCRATPGNRGVQVLRRDTADRSEFVFISFWDNREAIRAFAGEEIERAVYYPEDREFLLELPPLLHHYEVVRRS